MIDFTLTHEIGCSAEQFWKVFFSPEFNNSLYLKELAFPDFKIVSLDNPDGDVHRVVDAQPRLAMPEVVMKLLGPSFRYREEGKLDRAQSVFSWKLTPSTLSEKVRTSGKVKAVKIDENRCKRIVEISIEAKIFGVGGLVESSSEKTYRDAWERSAAYMNRYLKTLG